MEYIHVAGTNAKGSVAQYIYQILLAEGYSCGLFTSPHLFFATERFRMNGKDITQEEYEHYMQIAGEKAGEHLFKRWTRAALAWFADHNPHWAVVEVGIGGARDSTNVINAKIVVITPIGLDHTQLLGNTPEKIARDKCGVIKPGATVITFGQIKSVLRVIASSCQKQGAKLIVADTPALLHSGLDGQRFDYKELRDLCISAISPHQADNACGAAEAAMAAGASASAVRAGLAAARLKARVQIIAPIEPVNCLGYTKGLPKPETQCWVVVDGSHNPAAVAELQQALDKHFKGKKITVLTAVMRDKDANGIAAGIRKFADFVVCTCADKERGLPAKEYARMFAGGAVYQGDPGEAFAMAKAQKPDVLVVCGSFYLAGIVLQLLG